jgi:arabinosaccharide transport system substrate-binding protein
MGPLMADKNGDGYPDRHLLNIWETNPFSIEILLLQAGGEFFDADFNPIIDSEINARVISTIVSWISGPKHIGANAQNFDAEGNHMFLTGEVVCGLMPDWLAGVWMQDLPGLKGKIKLMPLPAWEKGGRRTSVQGGTMISIPERTSDITNSWDFAKKLYLSPELAETLFKNSSIISPIKTNWTLPIYDKPNPYFCGQANGRLFINEAPNIPTRTSSPFRPAALQAIGDAVISLKRMAEAQSLYTPADLLPLARAELKIAQAKVRAQMDRNFFQKAEASAPNAP